MARSFMNAARISAAIAGVALFGLPHRAASQHAGHAETAPANALPVAVDGGATPELIPDVVAWRHLMVHLAEPDSPDFAGVPRRASRLRTIGLSHADISALIVALGGVYRDLADIHSRRIQIARSPERDAAAFDRTRTDERALLDAAADRLREALSDEGMAKLEEHVLTSVKPRIKIYGDLPSR